MAAGEGVKEAFKLYDQDARRQFRGRCYPWQTDFKKLLAKPQSDGKPINPHGFLWQSGPKQDLIARGFLVFLFPLKVQTALAKRNQVLEMACVNGSQTNGFCMGLPQPSETGASHGVSW